MFVSAIRKALIAGAVATIGALGAALADGDLTLAEGLISLGVGLTALASTYRVPNEDPAPTVVANVNADG